MIRIGLHTAGPFCGVAVYQGSERLIELEEPMRRGHDQFLPKLVDQAVRESGIKLADAAEISVCTGPGSFTGIRVGVAFARGLALARGLQAKGVTSLEALIQTPPEEKTLVLLPAKIRPPELTFWAQSFEPGHIGEPCELNLADLEVYLTSGFQMMTSPEAEANLRDLAGEKLKVCRIQAKGVPLWAATQTSPALASPVYVRPPDAALPKPVLS